jgi:hypothetical protein
LRLSPLAASRFFLFSLYTSLSTFVVFLFSLLDSNIDCLLCLLYPIFFPSYCFSSSVLRAHVICSSLRPLRFFSLFSSVDFLSSLLFSCVVVVACLSVISELFRIRRSALRWNSMR